MNIIRPNRFCAVDLVSALCCLALLSGCEKKHEAKAKVEVSVFITRQDGESVKLGNVPVLVVPKDYLANAVKEVNGLVLRSAERCKVKIQADLKAIQTAKSLQFGTAFPEYAQMKQSLRDDVAEYYDLRFKLHDMMTQVFSESKDPDTRSGLHYTDADGKVSFVPPDDGCYIMAFSQRNVGRVKEKCCWLELVECASATGTTFQLSNNNQWDANVQGASLGFHPPPPLPAYPEME